MSAATRGPSSAPSMLMEMMVEPETENTARTDFLTTSNVSNRSQRSRHARTSSVGAVDNSWRSRRTSDGSTPPQRSPMPGKPNKHKKGMVSKLFRRKAKPLATNVPDRKSRQLRRTSALENGFEDASNANEKLPPQKSWAGRKSNRASQPSSGWGQKSEKPSDPLTKSLMIDIHIMKYLQHCEDTKPEEVAPENLPIYRNPRSPSRDSTIDGLRPIVDDFVKTLSKRQLDELVDQAAANGEKERRRSKLSVASGGRKIVVFVNAVKRKVKNVAFFIVPKKSKKPIDHGLMTSQNGDKIATTTKSIRYTLNDHTGDHDEEDLARAEEQDPMRNVSTRSLAGDMEGRIDQDVWDDDSDEENDEDLNDLLNISNSAIDVDTPKELRLFSTDSDSREEYLSDSQRHSTNLFRLSETIDLAEVEDVVESTEPEQPIVRNLSGSGRVKVVNIGRSSYDRLQNLSGPLSPTLPKVPISDLSSSSLHKSDSAGTSSSERSRTSIESESDIAPNKKRMTMRDYQALEQMYGDSSESLSAQLLSPGSLNSERAGTDLTNVSATLSELHPVV